MTLTKVIKLHNQENVLKGHQIIAQGKRRRSVALGWETIKRIVRAITVENEKFIFRTEGLISYSRIFMPYSPVRMRLFVLYIEFSPPAAGRADGFRFVPSTQGVVSDRSSRNYALGYVILPFQGEEQLQFYKLGA